MFVLTKDVYEIARKPASTVILLLLLFLSLMPDWIWIGKWCSGQADWKFFNWINDRLLEQMKEYRILWRLLYVYCHKAAENKSFQGP